MTTSNLKYSSPLSFEWVNSNNEPTMLILGGDSDKATSLKLTNTSNAELSFKAGTASTASSSDYHLAVSFRPGILKKASAIALDSYQLCGADDTGSLASDWSLAVDTAADTGVVTLYLLALKDISIPVLSSPQARSAQLELSFKNVTVSTAVGACNTRVMLNYQLGYGGDNTALSGDIETTISIVNHSGIPNAPITTCFIGSNTLVYGITDNSLELSVCNSSSVPLPLLPAPATGAVDGASYFTVSLEVPEDQGRTAQNATLTVHDDESWRVVKNSSEGVETSWNIYPVVSTLEENSPLQFHMSDLSINTDLTALPVKVAYSNVPGYWDGACYANAFVSCIDVTENAVGIGSAASSTSRLMVEGISGERGHTINLANDSGGNCLYAVNSYGNSSVTAQSMTVAEDTAWPTAWLLNQSKGSAIRAFNSSDSTSESAATAYLNNMGDGAVLWCENSGSGTTATINNSSDGPALSVTSASSDYGVSIVNSAGGGGVSITNSSNGPHAALKVVNNGTEDHRLGCYIKTTHGNALMVISDAVDKTDNSDATVTIYNKQANTNGRQAIAASIWGDVFHQGAYHTDNVHFISDKRIKNIKGISDSCDDLAVLKKLEITDYTYKAGVSSSDGNHKKVVAQQVAEVFPQAVKSDSKYYTPDVLEHVSIKDGFVSYRDGRVKEGDRVRIDVDDHVTPEFTASQVSDEGFYIDHNYTGGGFFYGIQVRDFHTVDYNALHCLNISATQELAKQMELQQQAMETQRKEISELKRQLAALLAR